VFTASQAGQQMKEFWLSNDGSATLASFYLDDISIVSLNGGMLLPIDDIGSHARLASGFDGNDTVWTETSGLDPMTYTPTVSEGFMAQPLAFLLLACGIMLALL
jgi:hypothetical protein